MTPAAIIRRAQEDGVTLALSAAGTIKATRDQEVVNRWLPLIREHKPGIVAVLQEAANDPLPDPAAEPRRRHLAELLQLVNLIADHRAFSAEDRQEALTIALGDRESALVCFRELAARLPGRTAEGKR